MLLDCEVNDLTKPKLTVIEGGIPYLLKTRKKNLINAYVTDTRLMGVLAIYAHWSIGENNDIRDLHQFFYIDCEESGFETYQSIEGNDREEIDMAEQTIVGGLGANKIEITERQLRAVLYRYSIFNEEKDLPLPEKLSEYSFILESKTVLDPLEDAALMNIICGSITSDYQVINYFMMRCIGQDEPGIRYLSDDIALKNPYSGYNCATFCKNVIDKDGQYGDGSSSYMCESLIEENGEYETVTANLGNNIYYGGNHTFVYNDGEKLNEYHTDSGETRELLSGYDGQVFSADENYIYLFAYTDDLSEPESSTLILSRISRDTGEQEDLLTITNGWDLDPMNGRSGSNSVYVGDIVDGKFFYYDSESGQIVEKDLD